MNKQDRLKLKRDMLKEAWDYWLSKSNEQRVNSGVMCSDYKREKLEKYTLTDYNTRHLRIALRVFRAEKVHTPEALEMLNGLIAYNNELLKQLDKDIPVY